MFINSTKKRTAQKDLERKLLINIAIGVPEEGECLESVRDTARSENINPNTAAKVYRELQLLKIVEPIHGRGMFVAQGGQQKAVDRLERQYFDRMVEQTQFLTRAALISDTIDMLDDFLSAAGYGISPEVETQLFAYSAEANDSHSILGLSETSNLPVYGQLQLSFVTAIASGRLSTGSSLPTVREAATLVNINPNTMQKAYGGLVNAGIIYSVRGVGSIVESDAREICRKQVASYCEGGIIKILSEMRLQGKSQQWMDEFLGRIVSELEESLTDSVSPTLPRSGKRISVKLPPKSPSGSSQAMSVNDLIASFLDSNSDSELGDN